MEGGIRAWKGMIATGGPEAGMAFFTPARNLEDLLTLAWGLEEGTRRFYQGLSELLPNETGQLLKSLIEAEDHHKQSLQAAFRQFAGREANLARLQAGFGGIAAGELMEGGVSVQEALEWARSHEAREILEFAMGLEINSYDLYIKMSRKTELAGENQIFRDLAHEEQQHLQRLGSHLNDFLRAPVQV